MARQLEGQRGFPFSQFPQQGTHGMTVPTQGAQAPASLALNIDNIFNILEQGVLGGARLGPSD